MRMLAIDMDGTCLNSRNRISRKTLDALRMAAEAGIEIVPTTGRALSCLPHQLKKEKYIRYVISSNGAVVTDIKDNKTVFHALIPRKTAEAVLNECSETGLGITAHANLGSLVEGKTLAAFGRLSYGRDVSSAKVVPSVAAFLTDNQLDVEELQLFFFASGARAKTMEMLMKFPEISTAATSKYVEVFSKSATKGNALTALANHLGIRKEHIACVGDGENDMTMFEASGLKFAMGNAVTALKAAADIILPSNNHNGIEKLIQKHLL